MASAADWLVPLRSNRAAKLRLVCFPYAGGGPGAYRSWPDLTLPTVEVWAAQPPGREARLGEPPQRRIGPVIEGLAAAFAPLLDRPFAFFGHSMGALLAFELTRRLRAEHARQPLCLFVSGAGAPHLPLRREAIHDKDDAGFAEGLRRMNGVPAGVMDNPELWGLFAPTLRADMTLCETYALTPGEPLDCPLSALGGLEDPDVLREDLDAWRQHTRGPFQVRMLPGDHFFIDTKRPQVVEAVSREIFKHAPAR
jgi:medium-chain acyl-[acyl-carrier-protein] hydrolase